MDKYIEQVFKNKKANIAKLQKYGFVLNNNVYIYKKSILNNQFEVQISISEKDIAGDIKEIETNEEYTLHLAQDYVGSFVGDVRKAYSEVLEDISINCFDDDVFKGEKAKDIIEYIFNRYGDKLEFLWPKFSNNAIARRKETSKWYLVLVNIQLNKLSTIFKNNNEYKDVLVLRTSDAKNLIDNTKFFPAYHMNKKNWISVLLDSDVDINFVYSLIDDSFNLAVK